MRILSYLATWKTLREAICVVGFRRFWEVLRKYVQREDPLGLMGIVLLGVVFFFAVLGPLFSGAHALRPTPDIFAPPSRSHLFGTDQYGRDVLARVIAAFRLDIFIALAAVLGALTLGLAIGAVCGYIGGRFDDVFMRVVDVIQSFPMLILAMTLVAFLGVGMKNVIIVTIVVNIPVFARLVRGDILAKKQLEYVDAARCSGCSGPRILVRHLIPNALGPIIVQASLSLAWAVLNVAGLSFLGIGINPPTPELGVMVGEGGRYLSKGAWWMSVFPGLALVVAIFAFNLLGDGLQDQLDPRRQAL